MKLTIITPTYTYQPAGVLRAEGTWEECAKLFDDGRLSSAIWTKGWAEDFLATYLENEGSLNEFIRYQETITRDGIKVIVELDPPKPD
jgi:hypothetical protein